MSEQIKYEAVFGPQNLFNTAPKDAQFVGVDDNGTIVFYKDIEVGAHYSFMEKGGPSWEQNKGHPCCSIKSMRRIIRTPVWTKGDQKAGKLPEVGCKIVGKITGINTVLFNNGDYIVTVSNGHTVGKYVRDEVFAYFTPFETPEERQQREREEWCSKASGLFVSHPSRDYDDKMQTVYDALLSGELKMPEVKK